MEFYISGRDLEVREYRALVNRIVMRMVVREGPRGWQFKGYDEDGDGVFEVDDTIAPKLVEIAKSVGAKCHKSDTREVGKSKVVDKR